MSDHSTGDHSDIPMLFAEAVRLHGSGDLDRAEGLYRKIIGLNEGQAEPIHMLGALLCQKGELAEGVGLLRKSVDLSPDNARFHYNLGCALSEMRDAEGAAASFSICVRLAPDFGYAWYMLGIVSEKRGRPDDAVRYYEQAVRYSPENTRALHNLGVLYSASGQNVRAMEVLRQAIGIDPGFADAYVSLAGICKDRGGIEEAVRYLRTALQVKPDHYLAHSNLVFTLHCLPAIKPEELLQEHKKWGEMQGAKFRELTVPPANMPDPERRLRIGYVSPDFRTHPVAYFIDAVLSNHDRRQVEVFCFSLADHPDAVTDHLRQSADHWRDIREFTPEMAAARIREDGIDILVDLAGHTGVNQMPIFACRPAPVQVTYLGYPDTTGLSAMDYRITDAWADPPGLTGHLHTEKLVRPGRCFLCYTPPVQTPGVEGLPALAAGHITFGCFNNRSKINTRVIAVWSRILNGIPGSHLVLKTGSLHDPETREELYQEFEQQGIGRERITLAGFIPSKYEHLGLYNRIDIALDTFPYNGTTTTCEAAFMGVPTITLEGASHYSRVGVSILSNLGLDDLVAKTEVEYVEKAMALAADAPRLSDVRHGLRERMRRSCLMDGKGFTSALETEYRRMWEIWCAQAVEE